MENFIAYNPTKLHFGRGVVKELGSAASKLGKKALLVFGKGSVLRNGSYRDTVKQLKDHRLEIVEYSGIKPNPLVNSVDEAVELGIAEKVDLIVAVGGGSVIDSAKIIGVCIADRARGWDVMTGKHKPTNTIPLIAVLTLAATGTEMNPTSVLQNHDTDEKIGFRHPVMFPVHSFLDPDYTVTVPANYTAYGIADLVAHSLEAWFGAGDASMSDRFVISIIQEALEAGPLLMKDLSSYKYRERIMWAATVALNDTTMHGRVGGDWGLHGLGHALSYLYDTAHGATLSVLYPAWMIQMGKEKPERIVQLGKALFKANTVKDTAEGFKNFFKEIGSPVTGKEIGLNPSNRSEIIGLMNRNKVSGSHYSLSERDRKAIVDLILQV